MGVKSCRVKRKSVLIIIIFGETDSGEIKDIRVPGIESRK